MPECTVQSCENETVYYKQCAKHREHKRRSMRKSVAARDHHCVYCSAPSETTRCAEHSAEHARLRKTPALREYDRLWRQRLKKGQHTATSYGVKDLGR